LAGGTDWKRESSVSQPPVAVKFQVDEYDDSQADALRRQSDVVAVARVLRLKLIAPLKEETDAERVPVTWGVSAVGADTSPFSGEGMLVAILDTGIDRTHSSFAGIELVEKDFTGEGNGDLHGHGTHFAGTVFGRDVEGVRIGIARGVKRALIGKVVGTEGSSSAKVVSAIQWAIMEGADLIAMSVAFDTLALEHQLLISGMSTDLARAEMLEGYRTNVLFFEQLISLLSARPSFSKPTQLITPVGNDGQQGFRAPVSMPAGLQGIVSVASLVKEPTGLSIAPFSNAGAVLSAPGMHIVSAKAGGGLATLSGTSTSAAHVVGVAALWGQKIVRSGEKLNQIIPRLLASATKTPLRAGFSPSDVGAGLVGAPQN
jgi:subtilisin family serine protease